MPANTRKPSRVLRWVLAAAALLVLIVAALPFLIDADRFRPQVEAKLSEALGRRVTIGAIRLSLFSGSLAVDDLAIGEDPAFGTTPFLTARSLKIGVEMRPLLFSRQVRITGITLEQPAIRLIGGPDGSWNFSGLGSEGDTGPEQRAGEGEPTDLLIRKLEISAGRITVIKGEGKPSVYDLVDLTSRNLSHAAPFPFTLTVALPAAGCAPAGNGGTARPHRQRADAVYGRADRPGLRHGRLGPRPGGFGGQGAPRFQGDRLL